MTSYPTRFLELRLFTVKYIITVIYSPIFNTIKNRIYQTINFEGGIIVTLTHIFKLIRYYLCNNYYIIPNSTHVLLEINVKQPPWYLQRADAGETNCTVIIRCLVLVWDSMLLSITLCSQQGMRHATINDLIILAFFCLSYILIY